MNCCMMLYLMVDLKDEFETTVRWQNQQIWVTGSQATGIIIMRCSSKNTSPPYLDTDKECSM